MHAYDSVFVCTLITIVFVCISINCCFGVVFYINMCIAHAKIFIYFTTENHFKTVGFFVQCPSYHSNRSGLMTKLGANRCKPVELSFLVWNLNLAGFFPVIGQTGLVYQNRTAAVSSDRSVKKLWSVTAI